MRPLPRLRRFAMPLAALVTALVTLIAVSLATAPPASAAVTGTTSTGEVVLYQQCQRHPIDYSLQVTHGLLQTGWRVELQVVQPGGTTSEGSVLNSATDPPLQGTVTYLFCGSEQAGTWTVRGTVRISPLDLPALGGDIRLPDTTFTVRAPATKTSLKKKHLGPRTNRLTTTVLEETPTGWRPANGVTMRLEKKVGSTWRPVRKVVLTAARGKASTTVKGRGSYRVVTPARNNLGGSTSRALSVR